MTGIVVAVALGTWIGAVLDADPGITTAYALTYGGLTGVAALMSTAWGRYTVGRCSLAVRGLLPFGLMAFIEDAHRRGVLRKPGAFYQFRHVRLQRRLRGDGHDLLSDHPHEVLRPDVSRLRVVRAQLSVPVVTLTANLLAIVLTSVSISVLAGRGFMEYASGQEPHVYEVGVGGAAGGGGG
ncbi:hypothetical protein ACFQ07_08280, partial [Actinomadura adrarensis]